MKAVFEKLCERIDRGVPCVLVSAVGGEGSVPRKSQAHMLVDHAGRVCGTVGGGAVEARSIELAVGLTASGASCVERFSLEEQDRQGLGMVCGGRVSVHFRYVCARDEVMRHLAARALSSFEQGVRTRLLIDLDTHAMYLSGDDRMQAAFDACPDIEAARYDFEGTAYYCETLVRPGRVYVFGGGHVAQALVPVLSSVDFKCVVIEDRAEFANPALFPCAEDVRLVPMEKWDEALRIGEEDYVCIMTRNHQNDLECQAFAMRTKARYIGVIGSRKKIASVNARLKSMGFTDADLLRIVTPIGLAIGARTPAEIAVSIAAQMIACRAGLRVQAE